MRLSTSEADLLLELLRCTEEQELDCDECQRQMAEFAESDPDGHSLALQHVRQHLSVCAECREVYEALRRSLELHPT